jgi:hypothetical protein
MRDRLLRAAVALAPVLALVAVLGAPFKWG